MQTVLSPSWSRPRSTTVAPSPCSSPTLPPLLRHLLPTSTPTPHNPKSPGPCVTPPSCRFTSPPTRCRLSSTLSPSPSSWKTQTNSPPSLPRVFSTPKTFVSSPPDISPQTHNPRWVKLQPRSLFLSTLEPAPQCAPQFVSFPDHQRSTEPTLPIDTHSARTACVHQQKNHLAPHLSPLSLCAGHSRHL